MRDGKMRLNKRISIIFIRLSKRKNKEQDGTIGLNRTRFPPKQHKRQTDAGFDPGGGSSLAPCLDVHQSCTCEHEKR